MNKILKLLQIKWEGMVSMMNVYSPQPVKAPVQFNNGLDFYRNNGRY
jgi:hypothetical protein